MSLAALADRTSAEPSGREGSNLHAHPAAPDVLDRKTAIVAVTAAVALTLQHYSSSPDIYDGTLAGLSWLAGRAGLTEALAPLDGWSGTPLGFLAWWCLVCLATYFVLPALVIRLVLRERLGDYGVKWSGALAGLPIYLGMLALVLPVVVIISADRQFQSRYPFYPVSSAADLGVPFLCWELLYAAQFVALEFFFRGFMVQGARQRLGRNAVLLMIIPYCMIHFGKPMPEALGAIVAGTALGLMSYRTRSIWLGAAIHVVVAWSMDLAVLVRKGILPILP